MGVLALTACHSPQREAEPCPQEDFLYQAEGLSSSMPKSILQTLDTLNVDVLSEKERAHYCLLKAQIRDLFHMYDSETDSLLQVTEDYFIGGKDKYFEAETYALHARIASQEGEGEQVKLEWLLKALQSIEQCRHVDERFIRFSAKLTTEREMIDFKKYQLHFKLGTCYLGNHYNEESLIHLRKAGRYFENTAYSTMRFRSAIMLGNAYLANKLYDSCLLWYGKGLEVAEKSGKVEDIAYSHFSMSTFFVCRFENQDYKNEEEGRQLLRQSVAECHQGLALYEEPMFRYKDSFYNDLSNSYFQLRQYDSCLYYSEKLLAFHEEHFPNLVPSEWNVDLYQHMYQSHEALGHTEEALKYAHLYFETQQAIGDQPKAVEQVKNEYDKKLEMNQLQNKQQMRRYRLYLLLALSLIVLLVVLWLGNRYRKNKEIEALRQAEAYRKLQLEFEVASQQAQQAQKALQQRVMELYRSELEDRLERIMVEFAATYPQGREKLQVSHPNLNETECHIVVLSFLGFRVKEEAELLGLSVNTVAKYRTNIRKKMGSDPVFNLFK
jgi:DNA-binding CsgD family transcriptional regulator